MFFFSPIRLCGLRDRHKESIRNIFPGQACGVQGVYPISHWASPFLMLSAVVLAVPTSKSSSSGPRVGVLLPGFQPASSLK